MMTRTISDAAGILISEIARLGRQRVDRHARKLGLKRSEWRILNCLYYHEGLTQTQIADLMEVETITVGRLVDALEQRRWVERRPDPRDRRAWLIHLTADAAPMMREIGTIHDSARSETFGAYSDAELRDLIARLEPVRDTLLASNKRDSAATEPEGGLAPFADVKITETTT